MRSFILVMLLVMLCQATFGQGEIDAQEKILFQNERSISLSLNSNGFAAGYRFGKRKTYLNKVLYDIELAYIKHPKETKVTPEGSLGYSSSRRYVPGKMNIFVNLRPSVGFQREIFSKEDKGSIAIKYYFGGGPSFGVCKPVYYTFDVGYLVQTSPGIYGYVSLYTTDKPYDYTIPGSDIFATNTGRASFWKGFDKVTFYPGFHAQFGLSFEYSPFNRIINALDVSATLDAFGKKIPIMLTKHNSQFFFTLSLAYRFGWVVDTKYKTPKITEEGRRLKD